MDRLRSRERLLFNGFTKAETEKLEKLLKESGQASLQKDFLQKVAKSFNRSSDRAGKPPVKQAEVQDWFQSRIHDYPSKPTSNNLHAQKAGEKDPNISELEFEARSNKDGAWYDVDVFLSHRFLASGEAEALIRFIGFEPDEDEWVNIKQGVRQRSHALESSECEYIKVGDLVLCFQERRNQAIHYDAHVLEIERKLHDIRGCRCLFLIHYDHDSTQERVWLRRLSCRPNFYEQSMD